MPWAPGPPGLSASGANSFPGDFVFALCIQGVHPVPMTSRSVTAAGRAEGCSNPPHTHTHTPAGRPRELLTPELGLPVTLCRAVTLTGTIPWDSFN